MLLCVSHTLHRGSHVHRPELRHSSTTSFLDVKNYPPADDGRRKKLLAHFNVPEFVANRTCFELNGYFGNKTTYDDKSAKKHVTSCSKHPTSSASTIVANSHSNLVPLLGQDDQKGGRRPS